MEALHVALLLAAEGRGGREGRGGEGAPHLVEAEGGQAAVLPLPHPVVGGQRAAGGGGGAPQPVHLHHHCNQVIKREETSVADPRNFFSYYVLKVPLRLASFLKDKKS